MKLFSTDVLIEPLSAVKMRWSELGSRRAVCLTGTVMVHRVCLLSLDPDQPEGV